MNLHLFPAPPAGIVGSSSGRPVLAFFRASLLVIQRCLRSHMVPSTGDFQVVNAEDRDLVDKAVIDGSPHIFQVVRRGKATWIKVDDGIATLRRMSAPKFNQWIRHLMQSGHQLTIRGLQ